MRKTELNRKHSSAEALALPDTHIAILDGNGVILETNAAWPEFARANGMAETEDWIGIDYLAVYHAQGKDGASVESPAAEGVRAVLRGDSEEYRQVCPCPSHPHSSAWTMRVTRLNGHGAARAVVSHQHSNASSCDALLHAHGRTTPWVPASSAGHCFIKTVVDAVPAMVAYWDRDLRCCFANRRYQEWFGKKGAEIIGVSMRDLVGRRLFALDEAHALRALSGEPQHFERILNKADGSVSHTWTTYTPDIDVHGTVAGFFVLKCDVTPLKEVEAELRMAASVFDNTVEGIVVSAADGTILSVNPAFTEITGFTAEEAIGQNPRMLKSHHHDDAFYSAMWRDIKKTGRWQGELWNRRKSGEVFLEWQTITRISGGASDPERYVAVFHDITERRRRDDGIRHQAFHDVLTDLPNRALLRERLDQLIAMTERERRDVAVMFLDLDGFKTINDTLGHRTGDDLLKAVAQTLLAQVRRSDTVARLGGDEFIVVLDNPANREEVASMARRIIAAVNEPMSFRNETASIGISIGIAMHPSGGATAAQLIESADIAMYAAKTAGKNTWRFFEAAMKMPK